VIHIQALLPATIFEQRDQTMNKIKDILRHKPADVWTIGPDDTVYRALEVLAEKNVGALPVMDAGRLIGIFSERDYARKCILKGRHSEETPVKDLMSSPVVTIDPDFSIDDCLAMMTDRQFRHLPVVTGGRLIGMVSIGDIGKWIISEQRSEIRDLEGYIRGDRAPH